MEFKDETQAKEMESVETTEAVKPVEAEPVESMEQYQEELEASMKQVRPGDLLSGIVLDVTDTEIIVDLKYYAEGVVRKEDYSQDPDIVLKEQVNTGEEISAVVLQKDDGQGRILLSKKEAVDDLAWTNLVKMLEEETVLKVQVKGVVKAGVIAYVEGIRGFIPASKLALGYVEDLEDYLLKEIEVKVITADPAQKKLVLSAKEILQEKAAEERRKMISNVEAGLVTEGVVETLQPYGAFVKLENGLTGLVHISQISNKRIKHPKVVLNEGDTVKVKITGVKEGKISLSMKALEDVAEKVEEESFDLPQSESISTNLGELFKNLKL